MVDKVLNYFYKISSIPRCSKNEDKIIKFIQDWAISSGYSHKTDELGNTIVVSGDKVRIILQSHVDMVCEKRDNCLHDFKIDPIPIKNDGLFIYSDGTSLGADNGIGMALSMFMMDYFRTERDDIALLFTVDEETGLNGAKGVEPAFLDAEYLINLDSEADDTVIVGCAGGTDMIITRDLNKKTDSVVGRAMRISVSGFSGGHSGVDIDKGFGNAIKVLIELLCGLKIFDISNIRGGTAHNAIPRFAEAVVFTDLDIDTIREHFYSLTSKYTRDTPFVEISIYNEKVSSVYDMREIIPSIARLNHGVVTRLDDRFWNGVESSSNLAKIEVIEGVDKVKVVESLRSSSEVAMDNLKKLLEKELNGFNFFYCCDYPGWKPDIDSVLLKKTVDIYKKLFSLPPKVEVIHAGLECGILKGKNEKLEIISIGPNIYSPHSPDERLEISSVDKIAKFLNRLLADL
ncbi:beta-Ala-His dipeptidase [Calditerrivibrio nitroreducens]|uniref:Aminoacyl-histidine dipeptidase n=1 Tax=Calditerrivibrio nitroreducens (strain DSM 19672 / NBRC 101217 / Yu37-1) TaxID=768670 RepID=E4TEW3_CALNY|nr:beta-Ala-His dipeptidase [Calditerrivibrio nitroreducens]ADR18369.1 aminoacyl-histidine dipeptidase [Calditerrivibrio nitroreducens DSM 19672]